MSILTVGSVAYDHIITPYDERERSLGGSVVYFSLAAQHFSPINLVAVVGDDFTRQDADVLTSHHINLDGLEYRTGKTFSWKGEYLANWNDRVTHDTQLNVFETFNPEIPASYKDTEVVFLGNIAPKLQKQVLDQMNKPRIVVLDTMNLWITKNRNDLLEVLKHVDHLLINDSEARLLSGKTNIMDAAKVISEMGPSTLCIKKGEHGALLIRDEQVFTAPAYPFCRVVDPTGAGDSFAGGYVGYVTAAGNEDWSTLKKATIFGSIMGSYTVEAFSVDSLLALDQEKMMARYEKFVEMTHFE